MSWASMRDTTRVEDMAYLLLGLFRINMPLLYGEGPRSFARVCKKKSSGQAQTKPSLLGRWGGFMPRNMALIEVYWRYRRLISEILVELFKLRVKV